MIALTGADVLDAVGLPPASGADTAWAERAAAAANAYVNRLPVATDLDGAADAELGGLMLAVSLYNRRAVGTSPDGDLSVPLALDSTVARMLRVGYYQRPRVG